MKKFNAINIIPLFSLLFLLTISSFAQVDIARQTTAVTYPLDEVVNLQFRGTTRFPRMKGIAKIKRTSKNGTEIDLSVSKMPRPFELGAGYATYVLWAISPDGQVDNLGEIKRRGFFEFDSSISVTTPLQTFALIITAEPHFLVKRPSRAIMLENLNPYAVSGRTLATTQAIQYFGNSSDYFNDARTPVIADLDYSKTPSTILQAKQAVALARYAGAQRDATAELQEAETLAQSAEKAWQAGRKEEEVDITARKAISAAVKAEDTALVRKEAREKRNEQTRQDEEIRQSEEKFSDAQNDITELKNELARETRSRELAERDALNFSNQIKDLRTENAQLRDELSKAKADAEDARVKLARLEGEKQAIEKQQEKSDRINTLQANQATLMQSLKRFGTVTKDERGIVLTLPENLWLGVRFNSFAPTADAKLSDLGGVLASNTDYKIIVESHTDDKGTADELQTLTQTRADALAEKFISYGVTQERIETKGLGATLPVAPNTTNANRAKNRRIQVILVPNI
ncbi:MAG TPA: OmpA family protein [Pyrinomonadaceae bacterium]|jgi:outer membrane protein OmpA-like peptidoglycan-associated protein